MWTSSTGKYGEFARHVTVLSNVLDGDDECPVSIIFQRQQGPPWLCTKSGWLPVGRQVTLVGRLSGGISETYTDQQSGETVMRKRPQIEL